MWVFNMLYTLHEEGAPPGVASYGSVGSAHLHHQVAPGNEEGPHQATWNIFIVSCWSKGAQVGRAEEEGSVSGEEDGELSDGNGSDVAIEDIGPILPLNDLLL